MKNFHSQADSIELTVPAGGVISGVGYKIGQFFVVATETAAFGQRFVGQRIGAVDLAKVDGGSLGRRRRGQLERHDQSRHDRDDGQLSHRRRLESAGESFIDGDRRPRFNRTGNGAGAHGGGCGERGRIRSGSRMSRLPTGKSASSRIAPQASHPAGSGGSRQAAG